MILKSGKKSHQVARHVVPEVVVQLKKGQSAQLRALKSNVAELKKDFATGLSSSRIMGPLMMKVAANS